MTALDFPANPSNGDTYENYVYDDTAGVWKRLAPVRGQLGGLEDVDFSNLTAGDSLVYDGNDWINNPGYRYVDTIYYTSNGTFVKADYPWLRAIRVKVQGGGGGSGGAATTGANQAAVGGSAGGGAYAESFITDIAGLDASVSVTRGAGGAGGSAGANNGSNGGASSFGTLVSANGGGVGGGAVAVTFSFTSGFGASSGEGSNVGTGDLVIGGDGAQQTFLLQIGGFNQNSTSGGSFLGGSVRYTGTQTGTAGAVGRLYGGGATGAINSVSQGTARAGAAGGDGIVIVELYA
jgi:hypothetical protein